MTRKEYAQRMRAANALLEGVLAVLGPVREEFLSAKPDLKEIDIGTLNDIGYTTDTLKNMMLRFKCYINRCEENRKKL